MRIWVVSISKGKERLSEVRAIDIQSALEYIRVASPLIDNDMRVSLRTVKYNPTEEQKYPI